VKPTKDKFLAIQTSQTSRSKGDKLNETKNAKYTKSTEDSDLFPEVQFHKWNLRLRWGNKKTTFFLSYLASP